jgi:hypothetical protein
MLEIKRSVKANDWRGMIEPRDQSGAEAWDAWFSSYSAFLDHYFDVAVQSGADVLVSGVELQSATTKPKKWVEMLGSLHRRRAERLEKLQITYDTDLYEELPRILTRAAAGDEAYLDFFGQLSFLGISFYGTYSDPNVKDDVVTVSNHMRRSLDAIGKQLDLANQTESYPNTSGSMDCWFGTCTSIRITGFPTFLDARTSATALETSPSPENPQRRSSVTIFKHSRGRNSSDM